MDQKRILVTGAGGMLGRILLTGEWSKKNSLVVGLAREKHGDLGVLACDLSVEAQVKKIFSDQSFDLVVHTAAYSDVDGCERDPRRAHESNALASRYLAQACGQKNIPLIYVSTDYVFDGFKKSSYAESDRTCPVNIYGMTKLEGEYHTRKYSRISAIVRTSWLFGPGNPSNFVNHVLTRLKNEPAVAVLDDQEDSPTYVRDLAGALQEIGARLLDLKKKHPKKMVCETYHVCNSGTATRLEMARWMKKYLGLETVRVERADTKNIAGRLAVRPPHPVLSTALYRKVFKAPLRSWKESLRDYLEGPAS